MQSNSNTEFPKEVARRRLALAVEELSNVHYLIERSCDDPAAVKNFLETAAPSMAILRELHNNNGLAWTTVSKIRGLMQRIYRIGLIHEKVTRNPVEHVETRSKSDYKAITISPDLGNTRQAKRYPALRTRPDMRGNGIEGIGVNRAPLVRCAVAGEPDSGVQALGERG